MLPSGILTCCTGPFWSDSLCLFGFCLPSLRCLISALTQAGGGDLLFRSLVQFSPAAGRAGRCRQLSLCVGSTRCVPATLGLPRTGVSVLSPSTLRLLAALYGAGPALSAVPVFGSSTTAQIRMRLRFVSSPAWAVPAAKGLALSPRARRAFSLWGPSARRRSGLRKSSDRNRGLFARWEGVASLGLSLPLAPSRCLLPPVGMGRLFSGDSVPLFCERPAVCSGRLIFSLALPKFKRAPSDCSQGLPAGPYPKQCRPLLSVPPPTLLVAGAGVWGTFLLGVAFRHVICGPYLVFPPS